MKSLDELKKDVFDKLAQFPKIEAFFKDSLEERIKINDNWIENALVHVVLKNYIAQDHPLQILMDTLYADEENFETLRNKLRSQDDYDQKMNDVLAELNGYYHLKKAGFKEIKALSEDRKQKKPDFSAEKDGVYYLFELKNLRSPVDLFNVLLDKYYARMFRFPEIYSNLGFDITSSNTWRDFTFDPNKTRVLYNNCLNWLISAFKTIESSTIDELIIIQSFEDKFENEIFRIDCKLRRGCPPGMIFGFKRAICISDPRTRRDNLYPFIKKIVAKVGDGIDQLLEFDQVNTYKKYLLINWQGSGDRRVFYDKECHTIVKQIDILVKGISDNIFVKLLDFDTLP